MDHLDEGPRGVPQTPEEGRQSVTSSADLADRMEKDEHQGKTLLTSVSPFSGHAGKEENPVAQ